MKTPAGICTEMTLPIDEIYHGHDNDSVNLAAISLTRYNATQQNKYVLGTPQNLLMIRKQEMYTFFEERKVSDKRTSYTTSFDPTYNTYSYSNISRLLSYCWKEKKEMAAAEGITPDEWAAKNPNWNKVVLIPVNITTNSSGYEVSVTHDMSMNSIRLVGGSTPVKMQVVYSKFNQ